MSKQKKGFFHIPPIPPLDAKGLRSFGFVTATIVVVLFGLLIPWLFDWGYPRWPWIIAAALVLPALIYPKSLGPVYRGWMTFGLFMSKIMNPLVLTIVFFIVITPVSLFMKLIRRKDPLRRQVDSGAETYREVSNKADPKRIERPF